MERDNGQATIEFALVLPFVVLLVAAMIQVAALGALQIGLVNAARAGARAAAVDPRSIHATETLHATSPGAHVTVTSLTDAQGTKLVRVEVDQSVHVLPIVHWGRVTLHASSTMLVEDARE